MAVAWMSTSAIAVTGLKRKCAFAEEAFRNKKERNLLASMIIGSKTAVQGSEELGNKKRSGLQGATECTAEQGLIFGSKKRSAVQGAEEQGSILGSRKRSAVQGAEEQGSILGSRKRSAVQGAEEQGSILGSRKRSAVQGAEEQGSILGSRKRSAVQGVEEQGPQKKIAKTVEEDLEFVTMELEMLSPYAPARSETRGPKEAKEEEMAPPTPKIELVRTAYRKAEEARHCRKVQPIVLPLSVAVEAQLRKQERRCRKAGAIERDISMQLFGHKPLPLLC